MDVSFDDKKPKIKSPRDSTPPKRLNSLRKLSSESQKLPSKTSDESTSGERKNKFVQKKKPSNPHLHRKLNLDKNSRKLGQNKSHSANNLHKLSVKDYHESFQGRRLSSGSTT